MNLREIVYDIITIAKKGNYTDDNKLSERYLAYKIHERRSKEIRDTYNRTQIIDPKWLQDMGPTDLIEVNRIDDTDVIQDREELHDHFSFLDCKLGRTELPPVVSLHNKLANTGNLGVYSITSISGKNKYTYFSHDQLMQLHGFSSSFPLNKIKQYSRIGDVYYLLDNPERIRAVLILENPLQGFVNDSGKKLSGQLVVGDEYVVYDAQVVHNGQVYAVTETFQAQTTIYTGPGTVRRRNSKRPMTDLDPYPMPNTMAEQVIMKILTQEIRMQLSSITDIRNNSSDTLKILQPVNE